MGGAAFATTLIQLRPNAVVKVHFDANNGISVSGKPTEIDNVMKVVDSERQWRRNWFVADHIQISFAPGVLRENDKYKGGVIQRRPRAKISRVPRLTSMRILPELLALPFSSE